MGWENAEGRKTNWVHALQHEDNVRTLLKMKLEQWVECKFYFDKEGIRFKVCSQIWYIEYNTRTQVNIKSYVQEQWRFQSEKIWRQAVPDVSLAIVIKEHMQGTDRKKNRTK